MSEVEQATATGRSCDGCTMCCKLLRIEALSKPKSKWCEHCDIGVGCKIYDERPAECSKFDCGYLLHDFIGDHWRPSESKMVIAIGGDANRITMFVDPGRPDALRKDPYYSDIKNWARIAEKAGDRIVVSLGDGMILVTPTGEKNLGIVGENQMIVSRRRRGSASENIEHMVIDRDDPVVAA